MTENDQYKTLAAPAEGIYKEKGSKFIAYAYPVSTEEEIKQHIDELRKQYYDARHHCFAWQLGTDGNHFRSNDDGEPSGTAGKPILGQLRSHELTNLLVVVIRYFGGTKLGTSGLIHAYKEATIDAINNGTIEERTVNDFYRVVFDYADLNDAMRIMKEENPTITKQEFDLKCTIEWSTRQSDVNKIKSRLSKIESAKIEYLHTC